MAPHSLVEQLPPLVAARNQYQVRDDTRITHPQTKSQQHHMAFLPATIRKWNNLPARARQANTIEEFKEQIRPDPPERPKHYAVGDRKEQIRLCQMRVKNPDLNQNLFEKMMSPTPNCTCGRPETTKHYLIDCPTYQDARQELVESIQDLTPITPETLLNGATNLTVKDNIKIALSVQKYIKDTNRFE